MLKLWSDNKHWPGVHAIFLWKEVISATFFLYIVFPIYFTYNVSAASFCGSEYAPQKIAGILLPVSIWFNIPFYLISLKVAVT